ncbi:hypothetical protein NDU88_000399 [Pleurodeles waltl]|uniref:Uncharacterized protein n=1 Tax=Pleurodeles waltl TaxID=8319 RepID=A0AAV7U599_PLEWA|nr:hypothetical protein NDU88_000399 [Pleurodeles waltl]
MGADPHPPALFGREMLFCGVGRSVQGTCHLFSVTQSHATSGISAGRISKVVVGNQQQEFFVVIGRAVDEVRLAEGLAEASTIILSPNAWELCDRSTIVSEKIPNERAVKVCGSL